MITRCLYNDLMHFYEAEPQPFRHMQVVSCSGDSKNDLTIYKKNPAQSLQGGVKCLFVSLNIHGTLELKKKSSSQVERQDD